MKMNKKWEGISSLSSFLCTNIFCMLRVLYNFLYALTYKYVHAKKNRKLRIEKGKKQWLYAI